jgi:AcrR family transcriptional regulator
MPTKTPRPSARERLLDAADELFYEQGVHTVGIDRVIERAGVAKASLYATFGSKDESSVRTSTAGTRRGGSASRRRSTARRRQATPSSPSSTCS